MNYLIFKLCVLLSFAISSLAVTVKEDGKEVDCSVPCACCREGRKRCGKSHICDSGCIDTVYGNRCEHLCKANCYTCQQSKGTTCTTCRETFYDIDSSCGKTCSVGCIGGKCNYLDGTCSCRKNFKGERCEACVDGRYGSTCDQVCSFGCATLSCDKNTGFCECNGFFIGPKCEICAVGDYGFPGYTGLKCGTVFKASIGDDFFLVCAGVIVAVMVTVVVVMLIVRCNRKKANDAIPKGIKTSNRKSGETDFKLMYEYLDEKTRE
ncbi:multiple epidermal growth factor-like domains protein 11 [Mya arenaria]|uniref:multiple epidermal growth factor-like domains protein 11 n=1 Tax=Mya arenaria TaxID=6604 RepID=UPI0022E29F11|nr:multiple epidermal growth factor-like domains protein 11 [Mya arenaria]XP_052786452.1 multiple epidermal growth factor-like domains protein 11 [Mya arenaria]